MLNSRFAVGLRLTVLLLSFALVNSPASGQIHLENPYDASIGVGSFCNFGCTVTWTASISGPFPDLPRPAAAESEASVSADVLRHPLSSKARKMLQKALHAAELGDHAGAIEQLRRTLAKYPSSAPYTHNFLGAEYFETGQFTAALDSFEQVVRLMPHDSANHSNYGLALLVNGQIERGETEVRKALELDRDNAKAKQILEMLHLAKRVHQR